MTPVPLTVIGGFLGAGKTTLVNHLLRVATRRYGVLVNDFGAIAIDAALIASRDSETMALTNGCVCCGTGADLGAALTRLAEREPRVEQVIVETSGVSDPWRVAQLALVEPGFALEPIVVVTDAVALPDLLRDRWVADTVTAQLRAAELLVLNKADQVASLAAARAALSAIRPDMPLIEVAHGAINEDALRFPVPPRSRFHAETPLNSFHAWHFVPAAPFDRNGLRALLGGLPASVLRVKGFCHLGPNPAPHLLQFAAGQWTLSPSEGPPGLVVIGTPEMPDDAELAARFDAARAK